VTQPGQGVNGVAVAAVVAGALFVYSGVTGKGAFATLQSLIRGQNPSAVPQSLGIAGAAVAAGAAATAAVQAQGLPIARAGGGAAAGGQPVPGRATQPSAFAAIAADAQRYIGAGYEWGGAPAKGPGHWDCSSFVNWVIGHDLGLAIPLYRAGTYTGSSHGPTAIMWQAWTGATTIGRHGADAQPGDVCCWQTHVGIAIGGGQMVSARNPAHGTGISTIDTGGPGGELLTIRRLNGSG